MAAKTIITPQFMLDIIDGPRRGERIMLSEGDLVVGRSERCGIQLDDPAVSPTHCGLRVRHDQVIIAPGGTVSEIALNGKPILKAQLLRVGDVLGIGPFRLRLGVQADTGERRFNPGDQVGPYRLLAELGSGSVGRVFEARGEDGSVVAIKALRLRHSWPAKIEDHRRALFAREIEALRAVQHTNVVQFFRSGEHDGVPWLAMELLQGMTLREVFVGGRLSVPQIERMMFQLCSAVAAVHDADVLHRDLKPANVMVVGSGSLERVVLADFGLAQRRGAPRLEELEPPEYSTVIRVGRQVGTPAYMPPEQTQGQEADMRSDVWSLGAILYELISGRRPFAGNDVRTVLTRICKDCPEPLPNDVAPYLRGVVYKCLQKRPDRRFANAREMVETLHDRGLPQLLPVGVDGPNHTPLTGCPFCDAPIEHPLKCADCGMDIYRYTDGQVLTVKVDNRTLLACGTCGSAVGAEMARCPTCGMVYSDLPPMGLARGAKLLHTGGPIVVDIYDQAVQLLERCPFCNAPRGDSGLRCKRCHFHFKSYVTSRVKLELAVGGWAIHCAACGTPVPDPDDAACPGCGLGFTNGQFPDGTRFDDEVPPHLLRQIQDKRKGEG